MWCLAMSPSPQQGVSDYGYFWSWRWDYIPEENVVTQKRSRWHVKRFRNMFTIIKRWDGIIKKFEAQQLRDLAQYALPNTTSENAQGIIKQTKKIISIAPCFNTSDRKVDKTLIEYSDSQRILRPGISCGVEEVVKLVKERGIIVRNSNRLRTVTANRW